MDFSTEPSNFFTACVNQPSCIVLYNDNINVTTGGGMGNTINANSCYKLLWFQP